jgi:hypothetical protein
MLELRIEELTQSLEDLIKVLVDRFEPNSGMQAPRPDSIVHELKSAPLATASIKVEDPPNEPSPTTTSTSQTSVEESKPIAYSDVSKLVTQIAKTDLAKAKAALARLGVKHGKELTEAQWPEAVAYLTRVANGEVDPEASHE